MYMSYPYPYPYLRDYYYYSYYSYISSIYIYVSVSVFRFVFLFAFVVSRHEHRTGSTTTCECRLLFVDTSVGVFCRWRSYATTNAGPTSGLIQRLKRPQNRTPARPKQEKTKTKEDGGRRRRARSEWHVKQGRRSPGFDLSIVSKSIRTIFS